MSKCLRCGAGSEWIQGRVPDEPKAPSPIRCDGRDFPSPMEAALHLLWLLQRLSYCEPYRKGMPADGPRFREGILEARKLLKKLKYEPK